MAHEPMSKDEIFGIARIASAMNELANALETHTLLIKKNYDDAKKENKSIREGIEKLLEESGGTSVDPVALELLLYGGKKETD